MNLMEKTWVEVDVRALQKNFLAAQKHVGKGVTTIAVIKANAYGHGLVGTARALAGLPNIWLGVDSIEDALILHKARISRPIIILGYIPPPRLVEAARCNFRISVYSKELLVRIAQMRDQKPIVHIKIETGTNRLGIQLGELASIKTFPAVEGIYTHFAEVENPRSIFYKKQLAALASAREILKRAGVVPKYMHSASTAALMQFADTRFSMARLGIGLYGLWPSPEIRKKLSRKLHIKPALIWKTRIAQIKTIEKGEGVGYDRTFRVKRRTRVAILPVGYYDGYDRRLSNIGKVAIGSKIAPIIGRVCMNMTMVDVTNIPAKIHDAVELLGPNVTADDMAKATNTINYEIVARINPLIKRLYL